MPAAAARPDRFASNSFLATRNSKLAFGRSARVHVAIVNGQPARCLLSGKKSIECRLSRTRRPPLGAVVPGDLLLFKRSGGEIFGAARAAEVIEQHQLDERRLMRLRREFGAAIGAPPGFWRARRAARYAVLIRITPLRRVRMRLRIPRQYGTSWLTLSNPAGAQLARGAMRATASAD